MTLWRLPQAAVYAEQYGSVLLSVLQEILAIQEETRAAIGEALSREEARAWLEQVMRAYNM